MRVYSFFLIAVVCGCGGSEQNKEQANNAVVSTPNGESKPINTSQEPRKNESKPEPIKPESLPLKKKPNPINPSPLPSKKKPKSNSINQSPPPSKKKPKPNKPAGKPAGGKKPGNRQSQQIFEQRWALLMGTVRKGQWPNYLIVQESLGKPDRQKQNVTMNTKAILKSNGKGAVNPAARNSPSVARCVRWDYLDAPKGQQSIQLYFFNGSLAGFQLVKKGGNQSGNSAGGQGGKRQPGSNRSGGFPNNRPKGGAQGGKRK